MATILLVEDGATVSREVTRLLEAAGHRVVRCGGGPTPLAACLLMRHGRCPFVDNADLVVFACALALPLPGRSYRGMHLLRAYRAHPDYGRLPLVLVAVAPPHNLGGAGPIEVVETNSVPAAVVAAVDRLLQPTGQTPDRRLLTGRAGVDDEAPPGLLAVSSADLRGVFRPATAVAGDRLALPHDAGRTVSGAPAARSCGEPLRYNEEGPGGGPWHPKPLVGPVSPWSAAWSLTCRRSSRETPTNSSPAGCAATAPSSSLSLRLPRPPARQRVDRAAERERVAGPATLQRLAGTPPRIARGRPRGNPGAGLARPGPCRARRAGPPPAGPGSSANRLEACAVGGALPAERPVRVCSTILKAGLSCRPGARGEIVECPHDLSARHEFSIVDRAAGLGRRSPTRRGS